ncbi:MAG: serine/threonine-protein kinase [Polyangiaceae bacterium]
MDHQDTFGLVGTIIDNRYRVDRVVGEGGFGVVYRGWHLAFDHAIAVKCLKTPEHAGAVEQGVFIERFRSEAKVLSNLSQHPSIVRVFDFGVASVGRGGQVPYMVIEWLNGVPLDEFARKSGPLTPNQAVALMAPAMQGLAFAHSRQPPIAHRDVKPANIFVLNDGTTKVLDFGIAKSMQEGEEGQPFRSRTASGFSACSPNYAAPEQFRPKWFGPTSPRTDVHAIGLLLCELVTGRPALQGDAVVEFMDSALAPVRPTPRARGAVVSDTFETICATAVALDPKSRYANAGALLEALRNVVGDSSGPSVASPPSSENAMAAAIVQSSGSYGPGQTARAAWAGSAGPIPQQTQLTVAQVTAAPPAAPQAVKGRSAVGRGGKVAAAVVGIATVAAVALLANRAVRDKSAAAPASVATTEVSNSVPSATSSAPTVIGPSAQEGLQLLLYPRNGAESLKRAVEILSAACKAGDQVGCAGMATATRKGIGGVSRDLVAAFKFAQQACSAGALHGCVEESIAYDKGVAVAKDRSRAIFIVRTACDAGSLRACRNLGTFFKYGSGLGQDYQAAVALYQRACEGGESIGCQTLGLSYVMGEGVARDEKRGFLLTESACTAGTMVACSQLGWLYAEGKGVAKDPVRAREYQRLACDAAEEEGCKLLAFYLSDGVGGPVDFVQARSLFESLYQGGNPGGFYGLARMYEHGLGAAKDIKAAVQLYERACNDLDYGPACGRLGLLYKYGLADGPGGRPDPKRAREFFQLACDKGEKSGCITAKSLQPNGKPGQGGAR